jgi:hypothetical protein
MLKEFFGIHPEAAWTMLATWEYFGVATMKSEMPMAHKVQAYLLDAGVAAATNIIAKQETGRSVRQPQQIAPLCVGGNVALVLDVTVGNVFGPSASR